MKTDERIPAAGLQPIEESDSASLLPFFRPRSVAVIGASRDPAGIGQRVLRALREGGFPGPIYPINPHAQTVAGLLAYPCVQAVPGPVDLAVVATPPAAVLSVADDCAVKGVPALLVITAGFAEVGEEGARLQAQLLARVRAAGMRLIGPNCLGVLSNEAAQGANATCMNATFMDVYPPRGHTAMSSDSGALGLALLAMASRLGLGVSACVSVGNRADVSSNDLLEYWETDADTSLILLYLESFGNPRRFAHIARRVTKRKPVIAVKAGRTRAGKRAAGSHTAALAVSDQAIDGLFRQTGVVRVDSLAEMFDLASALSLQPLPRGRRVGIVTNAGGPAILCADACEAGGLVVPGLSGSAAAELATFLPACSARANPVDLIASASPEQFRQAIRVLARSGEVDALIVIHVCVDASAAAAFQEGILAGIREGLSARCEDRFPVLACVMAGPPVLSTFGASGERIPCYPFPETPGHVLARMAACAEWQARPPGDIPTFADKGGPAARAVCRQALASRGPGWLNATEVRRMLLALGLALPPGGVAGSADEAVALAQSVGFPVACKLASHRVVHKTEVGGVHLDLQTEADVGQAFKAIRTRFPEDVAEGVLVQPMVRGGTEVLVGLTRDPLFGALLAFGLGGILVEVLQDVYLRVAPLTDQDAAEMVRGIRGYRLLEGYRGHPPADLPALEELLLRVSQMADEIPELIEMDFNPVFALPPGQGYRIIDARIRVADPASPAEKRCGETPRSEAPGPEACHPQALEE